MNSNVLEQGSWSVKEASGEALRAAVPDLQKFVFLVLFDNSFSNRDTLPDVGKAVHDAQGHRARGLLLWARRVIEWNQVNAVPAITDLLPMAQNAIDLALCELPEASGDDIASAKAAGFQVHVGDASHGLDLVGRWWWTLSQPGWSGVESSDGDFDDERKAWADAAQALRRDPTLSPKLPHVVSVDVLIPAHAPEFESEQEFTTAMCVARVAQAIKAWRVADETDDGIVAGGEPDVHAAVCLLADLRHYCDAKGLDFASLDRGAYSHYLEQRVNGRHHATAATASSPGQ